jgi:hypothetical protein
MAGGFSTLVRLGERRLDAMPLQKGGLCVWKLASVGWQDGRLAWQSQIATSFMFIHDIGNIPAT